MNAKRRKQIDAIRDQIEELACEEREAYESLPENLQYSSEALQIDENADDLDEVFTLLENIFYRD